MHTSYAGKDLRIDLIGDFDGNSAWELINTIKTKDTGSGSIILNTNKIGNIIPFGKLLFDTLIGTNGIHRHRIVIKGKKCRQMGIEGCRQSPGHKGGLFRQNGGICSSRASIR
jgi:hypothetical protein